MMKRKLAYNSDQVYYQVQIIIYLRLGSVHIQPRQTRKVSRWDGWRIHLCNHTVCVRWITNYQNLEHSNMNIFLNNYM